LLTVGKENGNSNSKSNRRSFDYASRDETARGSAQDDTSLKSIILKSIILKSIILKSIF